MSKSRAIRGLGDFLETWGKKPKPEPPRSTIAEEAKRFDEKYKKGLVEPPKPETVNATTTATTEVPKEPSNRGLFLKKALTSGNIDGAVYGGAIGYQYPDEEASTGTRLMSALAGALGGGYGVPIAGKGLKVLKMPNLPSIGSILNRQKMVSLGRKLPAVPIMFWDDTKELFKPTATKPEDATPPLGTPLGTPVNTNRQALRNTNRHANTYDD